jgi:hypothetical protein
MSTRETGADLDELVLQALVDESVPNQELQPTAASVRSCLASASSSSYLAFGHLHAALHCALYYQLKAVSRLSWVCW